MGKKRKSDGSNCLDEVDRTMYTTFCSAANSLSHLYTQSMNHQKLSFHAGERHALEKLYHWILRQQEGGGSRVNAFDILNYLQNEMTYGGEDSSLSSRTPQGQHSPPAPVPSGAQIPSHGFRTEQQDSQPRNQVFSNALSSPVRRSLQNYHIAQANSNDSSMDMNAESTDNDSTH